MSAMTYIQPHPKTKVYRIRRAIPEPARFAFNGKLEYLESLGTKNFKEAQTKGFPKLAELQRRIDNALAGILVETDEQAFSTAIAFIDWDERNGGSGFLPFDSPHIFDDHEHFLNQLRKYCIECGIPLDGNAFAELENVVECEVDNLYEPEASIRGEASTKPMIPVVQPTPVQSLSTNGRKIVEQINLSQLCDRLVAYKENGANKIETEIRKGFSLLIDLHGDVSVTDLEMEHIREYRDVLLKFPVRGRTKKILALPIRKIIAMNWSHTMSPRTFRKHFGYINQGYDLAVSEGWALFNPCDGIKIPASTPTSKSVKRRELRPHEMKTLFGSPLFNKCVGKRKMAEVGNIEIRDYHFWLPWVAFYTGARLAELCQLEKTNLRQDGDVWFLEITTVVDEDELDDKSVKNEGSVRDVPVHQALIGKGFVDFAQQGTSPLIFPSNYESPIRLSKVYSTWFGRYMGKVGLNDPETVFHSSRHNFKTACRMANIQKDVHDYLTGHAPKDIGGKYGVQGRLMDYLKEEIDRVEYEGIG